MTHFTHVSFPLLPRGDRSNSEQFQLSMPSHHDEMFSYRFAEAKQIKLKLCCEFAVRIVAAAQKSSIFAFSLDKFSFASGTNHVGHL